MLQMIQTTHTKINEKKKRTKNDERTSIINRFLNRFQSSTKQKYKTKYSRF